MSANPEPPSLASPQFTPSYRRGSPWPSWAHRPFPLHFRNRLILCPSPPASVRSATRKSDFLTVPAHLGRLPFMFGLWPCRFQVSVLCRQRNETESVLARRGPQPRKGGVFRSSAQGLLPSTCDWTSRKPGPCLPPQPVPLPPAASATLAGARGQAALAAAPPPPPGWPHCIWVTPSSSTKH